MVLSMEKEKWQYGNGERAIILLYKDYMERMSQRTTQCEQGPWTQTSGLRVAGSGASEQEGKGTQEEGHATGTIDH